MTALSNRPDTRPRVDELIAAATPASGHDARWWQAVGNPAAHHRLATANVRWPVQQRTEWAAALRVFLATIDDGVDAVADALLPVPAFAIAIEARAAMRRTLAARLGEAVQGVAERPATSDGWLEVFERRPALAFVVGVVCGQWRDALAELFDRFAADREAVAAEFWDGARPTTLVRYRGDAGDRHGQGRSVALLHFDGDHSVVYKPKELRHVGAVQDLLTFLNATGLELPLAVRGVLLRGDYGWEEFVRARPVDSADRFADFYRRLGMLTRVMQLLGGRDLWADNLIADGDQPMFIDLECVMGAPPRATSGAAAVPAAAAVLEDTVVPTALVVQPWTSPQDIPVLDVSCFSRSGDALAPGGGPLLPLPPYRPFIEVDGIAAPADPWAYGDEVLTGYREMHAVLAAHHDELLTGPLAGLRGAWVRCIRRNTWDCYKIIRASVTSAATADPSAREAALAALLRWPLSVDGGARTDLIGMALAEIDAFRVLDIPIFGARTDSRSVFAADGTEIADHFDTTSWDLLAARVAELPGFDLDRHAAVLASCLDASGEAAPVRPVPAVRPTRPPSDDALVAAAAGIARGMLAARVDHGWLGQTWSPVTNLRHVEILGPDLASGTAGFAVLLAELWAHTDDDIMRTAALDVLDDAVTTALAIGTDPGHQRIAGNARVPGGFYGPGAVVHALARCAERLREPSLLARADGLVDLVLPDIAAPDTGARAVGNGLATGRAGLLLNLLRLRDSALSLGVASSRAVEPALVALVEQLAPHATTASVVRGAVPGPDAGILLALARAASALGHLGVVPDLPVVETVDEPTPLAGLGTVALLRRLAGADARGAAGLLLARHRTTGRWFPDRRCDDRVNLGALDGTGAVALGLLGVVDPATRPLVTLH